MKTAFVFFRVPEEEFDGEYYGKAVKYITDGGFPAGTVEVLSTSDDLGFKNSLKKFKDTVDILIVAGGEKAEFNYKQTVADEFNTVLIENENAKRFAEASALSENAEYLPEYATLPLTASVIPNLTGRVQGFMLEESEFTLASLPAPFSEFETMFNKYVVLYLENKYGIKRKRLILKYFGDKKPLTDTLESAKKLCAGLKVNLSEINGDYKINLIFDNSEDGMGEVVRFVVGSLRDGIYAESDESLEKRLFDLLKLKKSKIAVAESFTGGRVVSSLIGNSGASEVVVEGIVSYSNDSKMRRLGVKEKDLMESGAVSSVVAYQMALGLLMTKKVDIAIATTGLAGPKSDDSGLPVGLCYIAVGTMEGVHTYKFNFSGDREKITETAKNAALFYALKNLKKS